MNRIVLWGTTALPYAPSAATWASTKPERWPLDADVASGNSRTADAYNASYAGATVHSLTKSQSYLRGRR